MRVESSNGPSTGGRRDPATRLLAALDRLTTAQGTLVRHRQRPWASITFSGTRHELSYAFCGVEAVAAGEAFIAVVPDHEFAIPGQIVAAAEVGTVEHVLLPEPRLTVELDMLLLEEG